MMAPTMATSRITEATSKGSSILLKSASPNTLVLPPAAAIGLGREAALAPR